jgi:hypothetical protein
MTTEEQRLQAAYIELARLTGRTVDEIAAMTREQIMDHTARVAFHTLGLEVAYGHDQAEGVHLMDQGPDEQAERITERLEKFHARTPIYPVRMQNIEINLFGFGRALVHFAAFGDDGKSTERYLLLSEVAEQLGIPLHKADKWANRDHDDALRSQRERDEERGELGWECLNDLVNLGLWMTVDDSEAKPDASGNRWSFAGDWLISADRILALMTISPWQEEFMNNAMPLFGHAMRETMGDKLRDVPTYRADGTATGGNAFDSLASTDGLTVDEAAKRAMRGPSGPLEA